MASVANLFNVYFTIVGSKLAEDLYAGNKPPFSSYLRRTYANPLYFNYTNTGEVVDLINQLKPKHSRGHDAISSTLSKDIGEILAPSITIVINQSLCTGIFPNITKIANVIPLSKKMKLARSQNYRPICLLLAFSKIFERVVFNKIYIYI